MFAITRLADYTWGIPVFLIALIYITRSNKRTARVFAISVITSCILNYILKILFHIPRPTAAPLELLTDYSFPSGHAMNNLVLFGGIALFLKQKTFWIFTVIWLLLIGISRIYLGVHTVTDVLGGYAFGLILLWLFHSPFVAKLYRQ